MRNPMQTNNGGVERGAEGGQTQKDLVKDIQALGIKSGDVIFLHSSLSSLGWIEGGADTVIDAFLEAIGEEGTLSAPSMIHTSGYPRSLYDPASSPSEVGRITEVLRQRPGACRSSHPAESLVAIGKQARYLTAEGASDRYSPWGENAYGTDCPWEKLGKVGAKVLLLGTGYEVVSLRHLVEAIYYQRLCQRYRQMKYIPYTWINHASFFAEIEKQGKVGFGRIAKAHVTMMNAQDIVDSGLALLEQAPLKHIVANPVLKNILEDNHISAGASKIDLSGGRGHPLARILVLRNRETTLVMALCELTGVVKADADRIRSQIERECSIPRENISICSTHVHSGGYGGFPPSESNATFRAALPERITDGARAALANLRKQTVYIAETKTQNFIRNENILMKDGKICTIRRAIPSTWNWKNKPEVAGPAGPVDEAMGVIDFRDGSGKSTALLVNLNVHDIPDFFERAAARVEQSLGNNPVVLITAGAMGDQDVPFEDFICRCMPQAEIGERCGAILSYEILKSREIMNPMRSASLKARTERISLPIRKEHHDLGEKSNLFKYFPEICGRKAWESEVSVMAIGDALFLGVPCELFAALSMEIKRHLSRAYAYILGINNDQCCYVATPDVYSHETDYHVDPKSWGFVDRDSGEIIKNALYRTCADIMVDK